MPSTSTTLVASTTVPGARPSRKAPASPNETSGPSGRPLRAPSPTSAERTPERRATRSSAAVAQAKRHPVSVHAALRTVSLTLPVASKAAEGSKPEWIAQCSQRASLPGPYSSHSIPSSSAS